MNAAGPEGPHPDRLLAADPTTREIARELLACVEGLPIVSPHGHVNASTIFDDEPFSSPTELLISHDHYVTRLLHANGSSLGDLGVGATPSDPREAWREFCESWHVFDGTASGTWLGVEIHRLFGIDEEPGAHNATRLYDLIAQRLAQDDFRPRRLLASFDIEVLATTDDPLDDLRAHQGLRDAADVDCRVIPTFRPDAYVDAHGQGFTAKIERLIDEAGGGRGGYDGYLAAMRSRRDAFIAAGAVSADHGVRTARSLRLDPHDAAALFEEVRRGGATTAERDAFEAHMLYEMAKMSVEDGLVMSVHPGSLRNHHPGTFARYGPDTGHDIPIAVDFTTALRPLLSDFGTEPGFHLVLFTLDESTFSRELAPLAGFYPSVYLGSPWWFLDAPDALMRFRNYVTETTGFSRYGGFVDDTRAFCSIPARHDVARRVEASYLARLVAEHRLSLARAREVIVDVIDQAPRRAFKL